ncbi:TetR/AcrR family transcriptional regulator [Burkholderia sp. IMCC1007]|uniref:TetR/AcrR family transcriptional regulator n=1 Tax=Burkholderia sp. IMCC1007 TaxID=3004104 RepID=UPI0022B2DEB0|nr:TetR/AcrR family transcriptional regulator [Burkholderia sp. IMCC1007]
MPATAKSKTTKPRAAQASVTVQTDTAETREPRGARRKRETRARLLEAALKLMAEKGMEGVAINEITEAADVGFGSFYNHFESKEAIYATLVDSVFEEFADTLDRVVGGISDPAEVISVSVRHTLMRAAREPVWGQFLVREGFSARVFGRGLGQRLLRDIQSGIAAKRFVVADPLIAFLSVGGAVLASVSAELNFVAPGAPAAGTLKQLGFSGEHFPERTAAALLQTLGIKRAEAEKIANRALPVVEAEAGVA